MRARVRDGERERLPSINYSLKLNSIPQTNSITGSVFATKTAPQNISPHPHTKKYRKQDLKENLALLAVKFLIHWCSVLWVY